MKFLDRQRAYIAHADKATVAVNLIAVVIAGNGPLYPLYAIGLLGSAGVPALLTMIASPLFYAVPWIARRSSVAGRAAVPLIGTLDTIWCMKLFGFASGMALFLLPCVALAALLYRPREKYLRLVLIAVAILPILVPATIYGAPLFALSPDNATRLTTLNLISVAMLLGLIALQFASVLAETGQTQR